MKSFLVSPAYAGELTAIANAAKASWGYPASWIRQWADTLTITPEYLRSHLTYVAWLDQQIVGFCSVAIEGANAVLDHLWVSPSFMRAGVGRFLFELAEEVARSGGAKSLAIESDPHAEPFYLHLGATRVGQVFAAMDHNERFLPLLTKKLSPAAA